jgi:hypothetical protein
VSARAQTAQDQKVHVYDVASEKLLHKNAGHSATIVPSTPPAPLIHCRGECQPLLLFLLWGGAATPEGHAPPPARKLPGHGLVRSDGEAVDPRRAGLRSLLAPQRVPWPRWFMPRRGARAPATWSVAPPIAARCLTPGGSGGRRNIDLTVSSTHT